MKKLSQLKEGDILYEYDLNKKFLNILYVICLDYRIQTIRYKSLVVSDEDEYNDDDDEEKVGIYIWFPENYDLEQPILVNYYDDIWSIFSLNYDVLEKFIKDEKINLKEQFKTALNIFDQREFLTEDYVINVK